MAINAGQRVSVSNIYTGERRGEVARRDESAFGSAELLVRFDDGEEAWISERTTCIKVLENDDRETVSRVEKMYSALRSRARSR